MNTPVTDRLCRAASHGQAQIGTVIFPAAPVKLFVTASLDAGARRRWLEPRARGTPAPFDSVRDEMAARDAADRARIAAPPRPAEDAVVLDTTDLDADTAFGRAMGVVEERLRRVDLVR